MISVVFQGVSRMFQEVSEVFNGDSVVYLGAFQGISESFQRISGTFMGFQDIKGGKKGVTGVFQRFFRKVFKGNPGNFRSVIGILNGFRVLQRATWFSLTF